MKRLTEPKTPVLETSLRARPPRYDEAKFSILRDKL